MNKSIGSQVTSLQFLVETKTKLHEKLKIVRAFEN